MKISVITVAYNSGATIVDTVESVLGQTHAEIEYIVIDGGSTDDTLAKLQPYRERIAVLVSEPDGGMYDAMNKGIAQSTGDVVAILNSDDVYADSEILSQVARVYEETGADCVYGDLHYVAYEDLSQIVRNWQSGPIPKNRFIGGWHPPHPSFFVRRSLYERLGDFQLNLKIAADYEWMLRAVQRHACSVAYLPKVLVKMRVGGASNRSLRNVASANRECLRAWRMNGYGLAVGLRATISKPLGKLKQLRSRVGQNG
jgi:glycosyltransferase